MTVARRAVRAVLEGFPHRGEAQPLYRRGLRAHGHTPAVLQVDADTDCGHRDRYCRTAVRVGVPIWPWVLYKLRGKGRASE